MDSPNMYNQQFSIVGVGELFSGFKHWYDVANSKLQNFVKGGGNKILNSEEELKSKPKQV